jgi:glycerophosphoryl diester phosphodiesterase
MPAFQHAVDLGYTYLETDVHATSDGVLVAFHDADLARTCGRPGRIDSLPWREVSAARVNGTEPIPLFEDLIGAFPEARFNIDCKANSGLAALIASLKRLDCLDRVCLGGFNDQRLRRLRREFGDRLCSSFGPVQMASLRTGARVPFGGQLAQVPVRVGRVEVVTPGTVARAHRRGYHVHVWTIDDPGEMTRLLDLGVDGIMTDRPQVLREVLSARGEWR